MLIFEELTAMTDLAWDDDDSDEQMTPLATVGVQLPPNPVIPNLLVDLANPCQRFSSQVMKCCVQAPLVIAFTFPEELISGRKAIFKHHLLGCFTLDFAATFPWDIFHGDVEFLRLLFFYLMLWWMRDLPRNPNPARTLSLRSSRAASTPLNRPAVSRSGGSSRCEDSDRALDCVRVVGDRCLGLPGGGQP